jgi:hypothetical protein
VWPQIAIFAVENCLYGMILTGYGVDECGSGVMGNG